MSRIGSLLGALVFLVLAAVALYRLLFYFPITVGGHAIGQTASFFAFAAFRRAYPHHDPRRGHRPTALATAQATLSAASPARGRRCARSLLRISRRHLAGAIPNSEMNQRVNELCAE